MMEIERIMILQIPQITLMVTYLKMKIRFQDRHKRSTNVPVHLTPMTIKI